VDPVSRIVGLVHAGWRGTFARIASATVDQMLAAGSKSQDIIAWLGPMAGRCCYEVDTELVDRFRNEFPGWSVTAENNERHLDLVSINQKQLISSGVKATNIAVSNICTIHQNDHFYSYRADAGTHGRIISAIGMKY